MTEREQNSGSPLAPANADARNDGEAVTAVSGEESRRKKWITWLLYIIALVIFHIGVIVLFRMTIMKFRTPKFRLRSATFEDFNVQTSNASFDLRMDAGFGVKNTNFGPYKFDETTIFFYYMGVQVGAAAVRRSKSSLSSTKKLNAPVDLISPVSLRNSLELASDLSSGILPLTGETKLHGKVTIMFLFKKKKSAQLDCAMEINISTKQLQSVKCK
ncbi:late embryogenesis abundant protein At1g64065-like [Diospyros lotus]|uniref:late embryogenesis abundant protein At1g64065-like n=1 Tax=Diospyros lotus TaxID=55363 RepID=UPI00224DDE0A|nr:late embryogenesis abundant protein At1g64065-like [Diospyros lotus]